MSLRVTLVASKFSLPIEAVTINMHLLSSSAWSDGANGLIGWQVLLDLLIRFGQKDHGGVFAVPGRVSLTSTSAGKGGGFSW